ncbi:hypothetical protein [Longimicrobium terrae]|uniref:Lipoprotein n=1 Tax=Longimicrobium terrae TaxID=1639882 RepID=A0A841GQ90_9BACT|nr:hypothetical protein [Longimicrobium terrae]MBB4634795.1 hypothetical protein [Longimicrobium terrae]MBB6069190.1 hypothetical protein [Longimicrobium terrae]NNC31998.1 hypothetical protein [Longimicrobium terrae]
MSRSSVYCRRFAQGIVLAATLAISSCRSAYVAADTAYQRAQDPVRLAAADSLRALVREYHQRSGGHLPFEERADSGPFMIVIGRSEAHEDEMARTPALRRGARWGNSGELEAELSRVLERSVSLPREPQRVATFAPNVYLYFIAGREYCVVVHLFEPSSLSVPYPFGDATFHSHAICEQAPEPGNSAS